MDEDGRWCLVGAVIAERRGESEEGIRGDPEERESEDGPSGGPVIP